MIDSASDTPRASRPNGKRKGAPFFRFKPIADLLLDGRSREFKRKIEIAGMFKTALGETASEPILASKIETAAELAVIAECVRATFMRGEGTADDVVRTSRAAALAEKALGIRVRQHKPEFDLQAYLKAKAA